MFLRILVIALCFCAGLAHAAEKKLGLSNETSLGYAITGGNSESESTSFRQNTSYAWESDILKLTGHYLQNEGRVVDEATQEASNQITAENWSAALRFERVLSPVFNVYVGHGWRGDRFQNVSEGHDSDIGGKYFWRNSDTVKLFSEIGYRYTRELLVTGPATDADIVGVGNKDHPEFHYARLYTQIDYSHSKTLSLGAWVEYLPSITDFAEDQRINYSPYLTSVLTDIFSLKVAYEGRYRYKPAAPGNKLTDFTFTTSLLVKF